MSAAEFEKEHQALLGLTQEYLSQVIHEGEGDIERVMVEMLSSLSTEDGMKVDLSSCCSLVDASK